MVINPSYQKEPSYCPRHSSPAPCLYCLSPVVAEIIFKAHKDARVDIPEGFLFMQADMNSN